ncbi:hypothetical protein ILUMI_17656, partial [Ignelater luminosus]
MTIRLKIEFDTLAMTQVIDIQGHIVFTPLEGSGFTRFSYGPINANIEIEGKTRKSKGIDYYNTKNSIMSLNITDGTFYVEGLFNDNQQL